MTSRVSSRRRPAWSLGRRLLARIQAPRRAGGLELARRVLERRSAGHVLDATVRLARGRTRTWAAPQVQRPAAALANLGLSDEDELAVTRWWLGLDEEQPLPEPALDAVEEQSFGLPAWPDEATPEPTTPTPAPTRSTPAPTRSTPAPAPARHSRTSARRGVVEEVRRAGPEAAAPRLKVSRTPGTAAPAPHVSDELPEPTPLPAEPDTSLPLEAPPPTSSEPPAPVESGAELPSPPSIEAEPEPPTAAPSPPQRIVMARRPAEPDQIPARQVVRRAGRAEPPLPAPPSVPPARPAGVFRRALSALRRTPSSPAPAPVASAPAPKRSPVAALFRRPREQAVAARPASAPSTPHTEAAAAPTDREAPAAASPEPPAVASTAPTAASAELPVEASRAPATAEVAQPEQEGPAREAPTAEAEPVIPREPGSVTPKPAPPPEPSDGVSVAPRNEAHRVAPARRLPAAAKADAPLPLLRAAVPSAAARPVRPRLSRAPIPVEAHATASSPAPRGWRRLLRRPATREADAPSHDVRAPAANPVVAPATAPAARSGAVPSTARRKAAPTQPVTSAPSRGATHARPAQAVGRARPAIRLAARTPSLSRHPARAVEPTSSPVEHAQVGVPTGGVQMGAWERAATQVIARTPAPPEREPRPSPPAPTPAPPPASSSGVIARAARSEPAGPTLARASAPATIARAAISGPGGDDGYDAFLDRLRRDLLREREQIGDLLGETPW